MAKSVRLELGDNMYRQYRSIFNQCDVFGIAKKSKLVKKCKISAITLFEGIHCQKSDIQINYTSCRALVNKNDVRHSVSIAAVLQCLRVWL